jgi:hypothetical protein
MRPLLRRRPGLAAALGVALPLVVLAGCANRPTFDEVEGVPDALHWSYFEGTPAQVADVLRDLLTLDGYTVEGVGTGGGGTHYVRVSASPPGADIAEVVIEPTRVRDFRARAQTVPQGRRLPRDLEMAVSVRLPGD